jgi:adenine-specific DNA-methyltransferase
MLHTKNNSQKPLFINLEEITDYCKIAFDFEIDLKKIHSLINANILPAFKYDSNKLVLENDLLSLLPVLSSMPPSSASDLFSDNFLWEGTLSSNTHIDISWLGKVNPAFYAAIRNLVPIAHLSKGRASVGEKNILYFPPIRVFTSSDTVERYIEEQRGRVQAVDFSDTSDFARSAYYMGSKRNLAGFLVEAVSSILPAEGVVVDLMCGSGAATRAFSRLWRTIATDIQEFCRILAMVQGGGFSRERAESLLKRILPLARKHANDLRDRLNNFLEQEDKILHGDVDQTLLEQYGNFIASFPLYSDKEGSGFFNQDTDWNPAAEVNERKQNAKLYPYCLFSAYFANVYFGLRQCIEIDSLRFAIDQIECEYERQWALGALITTLSALGTTYAAHFAQPKFRDIRDLNLDNLPGILEQRAYSIIHEFSVRLMNLSEESEKSPRPIEVVAGPWRNALSSLDRSSENETVIVYLDAPYKREEYSRYYHVLETAVTYTYPSSIGTGRSPNKSKGERPESEFFTRAEGQINKIFVQLITEVLKRGWTCAWSYADSGDANIVTVLSEVQDKIPFEAKSYATPYEHRSQGKRKSKKVTEYLIMLMPLG